LADLQWTVYPHSGHPLAEGRAQDRVSSPAKDRMCCRWSLLETQHCFAGFHMETRTTLLHSCQLNV